MSCFLASAEFRFREPRDEQPAMLAAWRAHLVVAVAPTGAVSSVAAHVLLLWRHRFSVNAFVCLCPYGTVSAGTAYVMQVLNITPISVCCVLQLWDYCAVCWYRKHFFFINLSTFDDLGKLSLIGARSNLVYVLPMELVVRLFHVSTLRSIKLLFSTSQADL